MTAEPTVRSNPPPPRRRVRDLGLRIGTLPPGPTNTIADVADVTVGHRTVWRDEPDPPTGRGIARTGITAIVPLGARLPLARVPAGAAVLNGAGEAIGITSIGEWATIETPIFLTSSSAIGRVYDGATAVLSEAAPGGWFGDAIMPVVAECDDGDLNRALPVQVDEADVRAALDDARTSAGRPVPLGVVGAGTGMRAFEVKGGIGSASRVVRPIHRRSAVPPPDAPAFTLGVLVMANFGELERLLVAGVPVGAALVADGWPETGGGRRRTRTNEGSCIVVVATDAPLFGHALERLARRAGLGLARTGSTAHHGSGEIFLAFSTGISFPREEGPALRSTTHLDDEHLDPFFAAVVESTEEAALDAIFTADSVTGQAGRTVPGLPVAETLAILRAAGQALGTA